MNNTVKAELSGLDEILKQEQGYRKDKENLITKFSKETSEKKQQLQSEINKLIQKISKFELTAPESSSTTAKSLPSEKSEDITSSFESNKAKSSQYLDQYLS